MEIKKLTSLEMQSINGGYGEVTEEEDVDVDGDGAHACSAICACYKRATGTKEAHMKYKLDKDSAYGQ